MGNREEVLEKIKKLLALTKSSEPNEAANAAARVQELMVKFAIEEHELDASPTLTKEPIEVEPLRTIDSKKIPEWQRRLAHTVAKSVFCHTYYTPGVDIYVVGRRTDREVMKVTYFYLRDELTAMCESAYRRVGDPTVHGKTWKTSFYLGAVNVIYRRLNENRKALEAAKTDPKGFLMGSGETRVTSTFNPNTAIILATREKEVEVWVEGNLKLRAAAKTKRRIAQDAYEQGKRAGEAINLNPRGTKTLKGK